MALPAVLLKAKNAISKGAKAAKTAKAIKSATSNSNEEEVKSLLGILKIPILLGAPIGIFILVVFIMIITIPVVLFSFEFGGESTSSTGGTGLAASVVDCARQQIGKPYLWGGEGPNAFDCSGLVRYCYLEALGADVPHQTRSLAASEKFETVDSVDQLGAGDIILDGGDYIHHVGIYTGEGTVVHAPLEGMTIAEVSLAEYESWVSGYETYRRYIG